MIPYIIHVGILITLCFLFYKILLERQTFFVLNRWFLLGCLVVSFLLPLMPVPQQWTFRNTERVEIAGVDKQVVGQQSPLQNQVTQKKNLHQINATQNSGWSISSTTIWAWVYYIYLFGVIVFGVNLLFQIAVLLYQSYGKSVVRDGKFRIVETGDKRAPCSFGNTIFINPGNYDWETYNQILQHEKIHVSQIHSLDILLAEFALVFQWFNPFAWLYRKNLENNLEFLTDNSVIQTEGIEKSGYQMSLLKVSAPHLPLGITTNYNQSLLKKRIVMMNGKKSSVHSVWKYFFLLPVLTLTVCLLNKPILSAQNKQPQKTPAVNPTPKPTQHRKVNISSGKVTFNGQIEGSWFATIKKDKISFEFKSDDGEHWNSNSEFNLIEFPDLPKNAKGTFKLTRDAGAATFEGKFDGDRGMGHFVFTADNSYKEFLDQQGFKGFDDQELFGCFLVNVTKDYVQMIKRNNVEGADKDNLIALAALEIDEPYIKSWKTLGYDDLNAENYITGKSLEIDGQYVKEIENAGYKNLEFDKLVSFKAMEIDGAYIQKLAKARPGTDLPSADQIISYKALEIDDAFVKQFVDAGYSDISYEDLTSLKSLGISASYIKGFEALGYKNIPIETIVSFKSLDIKPAFIKGFNDLGFKNIDLDEITSLKATGVTPEYVTSMRKKGFNSKDLNKYIQLKSSFE
ncbi:MAG: peptidase M56, BlaR1 [Bacteroidetes bacterium]|nr:MAG: peptidase M56, BlaR1 [Bacteroidota bacterium]